MLNVAIYFRYSSSQAAQVQNSEKRQRVELIDKALTNDWNIVWNNGDKETSGDKTKPKLEELKKEVRSGKLKMDILLVSSFDRLTRKDSLEYSEDVSWIRDAGAKLCILDNGNELIDLNDNQRLLLLQMKVFAGNQFLKDLANKTASGQTARFKRGDLGFSNVPFGFERDGDSIKANADMEIVKEVFEVFCKTEVIADCIPSILRSARYKDKEKGANVAAVKRILRHPLYIGKRVWGVESPGDHYQVKGLKTQSGIQQNRLVGATETIDVSESIGVFVEEELWFKANAILDHNKELFGKKTRKRDGRSKYKYSGFIRCACGKRLVGLTNPSGSVSYRCPEAKLSYKKCGKTGTKSISESDIDMMCRFVKKDLQTNEQFHRENFDNYVGWLEKKKIRRVDDGATDIENLEIKRKKLNSIIEVAISSSGGDVPQSVLDIVQQKREEIAAEEQRLKELADNGSDIEELFSGQKRFDDGNLQQRLDHIREYANRVIENPENKDIIFSEYYGLLKLMIKDGRLAPVYINGIDISFKKGKDSRGRKRNVPRLVKFDIGQMSKKLDLSGTKLRKSICLYVSPVHTYRALLVVNK